MQIILLKKIDSIQNKYVKMTYEYVMREREC